MIKPVRKTTVRFRSVGFDGKVTRGTSEVTWTRVRKSRSGKWVPLDDLMPEARPARRRKAA